MTTSSRMSDRQASGLGLLACLVFVSLAAAQMGWAQSVKCLTEPIRSSEMSVTIPGTVTRIHFGEGSFVESGTVILELDTRSERLDIERRTVQVNTLRSMLERSETLLAGTGSISEEEVDQTRGEFKIASLELELAKVELQKKQIVAPFSGIVTRMPIELGEYSEAPDIALVLVDVSEFYAVANIEPEQANELSLGDTVGFTYQDMSGSFTTEGRIVYISPVLDPASGLLRIKALFSNPESKVRPGAAGLLELNRKS